MTGRPVQAPRALLCTMEERVSAAGRVYAVGWLGGSKLLGFWADGQDRDGKEVRLLKLYVQEAEPKPQERQVARPSASASAARDQRRQEREHRAALEMQGRHEELNDEIPY